MSMCRLNCEVCDAMLMCRVKCEVCDAMLMRRVKCEVCDAGQTVSAILNGRRCSPEHRRAIC